jgi:hypothetical protein
MKMRLTTAEEESRHVIFRDLSERAQALDETIVKVNALIATARQQLQTAVNAYNDALLPARDWSLGIAAEIDQELVRSPHDASEARAACLAWSEELTHADFEPIVCDFPDRVVLEIEDHPHLLLDLSSRATVKPEKNVPSAVGAGKSGKSGKVQGRDLHVV